MQRLVNWRGDPFDEGTVTPYPKTEYHLVPSNSPYQVQLEEVPLFEESSNVTVTDMGTDGSGSTALTEMATAPGSDQYRVDYDTMFASALVQFNAAQASHIVKIEYKGIGSPVLAGSIRRMYDYPAILSYFGDGSDGSFTSSGNVTLDGIKQYTDFNLQSGHTITVGSKGYLIILCQGLCIIAGNGTATGKGTAGVGTASRAGDNGFCGGAAGAGGSTSSVLGGKGGDSYFMPGTRKMVAGGVAALSTNGTPGAAAPADLTELQALVLALTFYNLTGAAGGANHATAVPGSGGGTIVVMASAIMFTGSLVAGGANGATSLDVGSGGGGGGFVGMCSPRWLLDTGTLSAPGGNGGAGALKNGGNGGPGKTAKIDLSMAA